MLQGQGYEGLGVNLQLQRVSDKSKERGSGLVFILSWTSSHSTALRVIDILRERFRWVWVAGVLGVGVEDERVHL